MITFIFIIIFLVCILLTAVVLVQESKGGGLASGFSSANQMVGVKRTTEFLEKATWGLAISLMVLCLAAAAVGGGKNVVEETDQPNSVIQEYIDGEAGFTPATAPAQAPAIQPEEKEGDQ